MRLPSLRRDRARDLSGVIGTARLDRRTRSLAKRLRPGDIAIIDHVDIDRAAAVALVEAGVAAVVNVAPSVSGRYPNLGPGVLLDAGIPLVDRVDTDVFTINEGDQVRVDGDSLYLGTDLVASGVVQTLESLRRDLEASKEGMATQLEAFSVNAVEHLRREQALLLDGEGVPALSTPIEGRHVVVVTAAFDHRQELASLKTFIKENAPVLIGVDAGAEALLAAGHRPDVVVTGFDEVSDTALRCGAEVIAHTSANRRTPGVERADRLGITLTSFATNGTPEDAALLLAHFHHARLIVMVGAHSSLIEFLDKGRSGMASSFLTRAAIGSTVVDAPAVARLYENRVRGWLVFLLVVVGIALVVAAIATTPVGQEWWDQLSAGAVDLYTWGKERVT